MLKYILRGTIGKDCLFIFLVLLLYSCQSEPESKPEKQNALPNKNVKEIPFADTLSPNWITVKAIINNKPAYLILDNGTALAYELVLFKHYAVSSGMIDSAKLLPAEMKRIAQQPMPVNINNLSDTLHAEIMLFPNAPVHKVPDGLLGRGFLVKHVLELDYKNRIVKIHDTLNYHLPDGYKPISLEPTGPFYAFDADLFISGKRIKERLCLDLGSSHDGLLLKNKRYKKYKKELKVDTSKKRESFTVFSKSQNASVVLDSLVIGGLKIKNLLSTVEIEKSVWNYDVILIGNAVLQNAGKVFFDFKKNRMYLPAE